MNVIETGLSDELVALLESCGLPAADLREGRRVTLLAAEADGLLLGCVGYEITAGTVLLRSLAVRPVTRRLGLGRRLVEAAEQHAKGAGGTEVLLLTTSAAPFFEQLGYARIDRAAVPDAIAMSTQFRELCPATAWVMRRPL